MSELFERVYSTEKLGFISSPDNVLQGHLWGKGYEVLPGAIKIDMSGLEIAPDIIIPSDMVHALMTIIENYCEEKDTILSRTCYQIINDFGSVAMQFGWQGVRTHIQFLLANLGEWDDFTVIQPIYSTEWLPDNTTSEIMEPSQSKLILMKIIQEIDSYLGDR